MNRKQIMMSIIACIAISVDVKSSTLEKILKGYCVPKSENECSGSSKAKFSGDNSTVDALTKNYCECSEDNMYYDEGERRCKECLSYEFTPSNKETKCSPIYCKYTGDYPIKVEGCPEGYERIEYKEYIK